jgi:hypothetical protein
MSQTYGFVDTHVTPCIRTLPDNSHIFIEIHPQSPPWGPLYTSEYSVLTVSLSFAKMTHTTRPNGFSPLRSDRPLQVDARCSRGVPDPCLVPNPFKISTYEEQEGWGLLWLAWHPVRMPALPAPPFAKRKQRKPKGSSFIRQGPVV